MPGMNKGALRKVLVCLGFAAVAYVSVGSLALPHGPDQAIFAWIGDVILDGGVPYRNAWDIKGPFTYYIYAFAQGVLGQREIAIRLFDLVTILCGCWLLRKLVARLNGGNGFGASCAVVCYCLIYYSGGYADTAQPEGWGGLLILAVLWLLVVREAGTPEADQWPPATAALAGVLIACAALIKPTFLIYIALPVVHLFVVLFSGRRPPWKGLFHIFLGFFLVLGLALALLFEAAALKDFGDILQYLYTTYETVDRPGWSDALRAFPVSLLDTGILVPLLVVPIGLLETWRRNSRAVAVSMLTWLLLAITTVTVQAQFWQDHWLPAALATSAIFGVALNRFGLQDGRLSVDEVRRTGEPRAAGIFGTTAALVIVLLVTFVPQGWRAVARNSHWPVYVLGFEERHHYIRQVTAPFNEVSEPYNYTVLCRLSSFIAAHSQPSDRLAIWGWDVPVFTMSGRESATRFGVFQPLIEEGPVKSKYQRMFLDELAGNDPKYVVVDTHGAYFMPAGSGLQLLHEFPEFDRYLQIHYRLLTNLDVYQVWIRSPSGPSTVAAGVPRDQTKN